VRPIPQSETKSQNQNLSLLPGYPTGQVAYGHASGSRTWIRTDLTKTIVALGDSTTAGTPGFTSPIEAPPHGSGNVESQYAYWLMQAHPDWRVLNRGVNGERSDHIRARFQRDVVDARADAVVIIAGVNDVYQGRGAASVERELDAMYAAARAATIVVVAGSIIPYDTAGDDDNARMHAINDWIRAYAAAHPDAVVFCDTRAAVAAPGHPDRLVSSPDGLHPSPQGYKLMAAALEPAIGAALAKAQALR
jgi:lysophospholipase L1-like esterase